MGCSSPPRALVAAVALLLLAVVVPAVVACQLGQSSAATDNVLNVYTTAAQRFSVNRACSLWGAAIEINWASGPVHLGSSSYNFFMLHAVAEDGSIGSAIATGISSLTSYHGTVGTTMPDGSQGTEIAVDFGGGPVALAADTDYFLLVQLGAMSVKWTLAPIDVQDASAAITAVANDGLLLMDANSDYVPATTLGVGAEYVTKVRFLCPVPPSSTPSASPSPTWTPSASPSSTWTPSASPSPSPTSSPSASASPSPTSSLSSTPSASPSASPSGAPVSLSLIASVTAEYDAQVPSVQVSAEGPQSGGSAASTVGYAANFNEATIGDGSAQTLVVVGVQATQLPVPGNPAAPPVPATIYTSNMVLSPDTTVALVQSFSTHPDAAEAEFAATPYSIPAGALKWSLDIRATPDSAVSSPITTEPLTLRYAIVPTSSWGEGETATIQADSSTPIVVAPDVPRPGVTTYWLPLVTTDLSLAAGSTSSTGTQTLVAKVEVFDVAIIDDVVVPLVQHSIVRSALTGGYELSVTFPAIERSLLYDPTINLGLLVGDAKKSESGGDGGNMMMIGAGVAVPVALIAVLAVAIAGVAIVRRRRRKATTQLQAMIAQGDLDSNTNSPVSTSVRPHWVSRFSLAEQSNELWDGDDLRSKPSTVT